MRSKLLVLNMVVALPTIFLSWIAAQVGLIPAWASDLVSIVTLAVTIALVVKTEKREVA